MRKIAILHTNDDHLKTEKLIQSLMTYKCTDEIYVFTKNTWSDIEQWSYDKCKIKNIVFENEDTEPKQRNAINRYFRSIEFSDILHVVSDSISLKKDPTVFLSQLETMMKTLDYSVWLNTYTDKCNFVYNKYIPRVAVALDKPELGQLGIGSKLIYTSHSNVNWMAYDFAKISDDLLRFDEDFVVPMYFIIEFLSRRRNTKSATDLYFMNQYVTVESEAGVFECDDSSSSQFSPETMKNDDAKFKAKNVNHQPDNNLDNVFELTYTKLNSKL